MNMKYIKLISILCLVFVFCGCVAGADIEVSDVDASHDASASLTVTPSGELVPVSGQVSDSINKVSSLGEGESNGDSNPYVDVYTNSSGMSESNPHDQFINESFTFNIDFKNIGSATGYQPIIELIVPKEIDITGNSYLGNSIKMEKLGICDEEGNYTLYNNYTNMTYVLDGTYNGSSLYVIHLPLGSFAPDEPTSTVSVNAFLNSSAELGKLLNITVNPVFRFGDGYIDDPERYPPIYGETDLAYVNPDVVRVNKYDSTEENERATGPNYKYTYYIDIDIANGQSVEVLTLSDAIPSQLLYNGSLKLYCRGEEISPDQYTIVELPSADRTGGNIVITFNEPFEGREGNDIHMSYDVWAPRYDNSTGEDMFILDPNSGSWNLTNNTVNVVCRYRNVTFDRNDSEPVTLKPLAIQKHIYDVSGQSIASGFVNVGDNLTYSLNFEVSDYFSLTDIIISDMMYSEGLGPGQEYINNSMVLIYNGTEYLLPSEYYTISEERSNAVFSWISIKVYVSQFLKDYNITDNFTGSLNVSDELGPAVGGIIKFNATVTPFFDDENQTSVSSQDMISNGCRVNATLTSNHYLIIDESNVHALVRSPTLSKSIYAVNNDTTRNSSDIGKTVLINPNDNVTFLIDAYISTSVDGFTVTDYLPSPLFNVTSFNRFNSTTGEIPAINNWAYTLDSEIPTDKEGNLIYPEVAINSSNNWISFSYGNIFEEDRIFHLKILFTVVASTEQFADELYLTNLLSLNFKDSLNTSYHNESIVGFVLDEPDLSIEKSVEVLEHNISGKVQGETIGRYTVVITNIGHYDAFDVTLCDNFTESHPGDVIDFQIVYGNGTVVPVSQADIDNFFNPSIGYNFGKLSWAGENNETCNNISIIYTVNYTQNNIPGTNITNVANITNFASVTGGANYATNPEKYSDNATVEVANLTFNKKFIGSADYNSTFGTVVDDSNRKQNLTIGEAGIFNLTINLPNLNLTGLKISDIIDSNMKYLGYDLIYEGVENYTGHITQSNSTNGFTLTFDDTLVPTGGADADHKVIVQLRYVVENSTSFSYSNASFTKTNKANITWNDFKLNSSANVNIYQPILSINKTFNKTEVEGNENVTLTIIVKNIGKSTSFNNTISDDLNDLINKFSGEIDVNSTIIENYHSEVDKKIVGNVLYLRFEELAPNETITVKIPFTVKDDFYVGDNLTNTAFITAYSTPEDKYGQTRLYNNSSSAKLNSKILNITKKVNSTSISENRNNVTIGENVTFNITVSVVNGTYAHLNVTDTLPVGFEYVEGTLQVYVNDQPYTDGSHYNIINVENKTIIIEFDNDFAQYAIANSNGVFNIRLNATVLNQTVNNRSSGNKTNLAELRWNEGHYANSTADVTLVEPDVKITKNFNVTKNVTGGDVINFVINATNNGSSPLFNVTILDDLSSLINSGAMDADLSKLNITIIAGNESGELNVANNSNVLIVTVPEIGIKQSVVFKVEFKVLENITITLNDYINKVNVTGYSNPEESDDDYNRAYMSNASDKFNTKLPTIDKYVNYTSIDNGLTNVTIGENITYVLNVTLPIGHYEQFIVNDTLPSGIVFVDSDYESIRELSNNNKTIKFTFNNIDATSEMHNILIKIYAVVDNSSSKGQTKTNVVDLILENKKIDNDSAVVNVVEPNVTINKTVNKSANVKAGDVLNYTIVVKNKGTSPLFNTTIVDDLSVLLSGFTNVDSVTVYDSNGTNVTSALQDGILNLNVGELGIGESVTYVVVFTVKADVVIGSNYTNVANVTGYSVPTGNEYYKSYNANDNAFFDTADPSITKVVDSTGIVENGKFNATIGENVVYLINVTAPAGKYENLTVVDSLPAGLEFVRAVLGNGSEVEPVSGTTFEFINYLSDGSNLLVYVTAVVTNDSGNVDGTPKVNNVVLYSNGTNFGSDNANITIVEPAISIVKNITNTTTRFNATETVQYHIVIQNYGDSPAYEIHIDDKLDETLVYLNPTASKSGWTFDYNATSRILTISGDYLAIGESVSFDFVCGFNDIGKNITNVANVTISSVNNSTIVRNYTNSSKTDIYVVATDIQVNKTCTSDVVAGQEVTYRVIVICNGPDKAFNVTLKELFDDSYLSNVSYQVNGSQWISIGSERVVALGDMNNGDSFIINVKGLLNHSALGVLNNTVKVTTDTNETNYTNNNDTNLTNITTKTEIDVLKLANETVVIAGNNISYTINVTIKGPSDARNVTLVDVYDNELLLDVEYSLDGTNWITYTKGSTIYLGNMSANSSKLVYFRANVNASTHEEEINNTVTINTITPHNGTNTSTNITPIELVTDITIDKTANVSDVNPGEYVSYTIVVGADGISNSTNVSLVDILNITYLDVSNAHYSVDGAENGIWNGSVYLGTMAPGQNITIIIYNIKVKDVDDYNENNIIPNVANVTSYDIPEGRTDDANITVILVDVAVEKNMTHGNYKDEIVFTINVTNNGPNSTSNVVLEDIIPTPDFIYVGYESTNDTYYDAETGLWYVGNLNPGDVEYLYITCIINKTGYVENNVTVTNYTGHDTNMSNNNDTVNDTIPLSNDLAINKTVESYGNYTENIVYVIVVTNNGPDNATGVNVSDALPHGIIFINASEEVSYEIDEEGNEYLNWFIGDLEVGASVNMTITCLINTTGNVTNFVNVTGNEYDWNMSNNYDNVTVEIDPAADLAVNKTANLVKVTIGDKVVYTIVVWNNGPDTAPNAYAIDKLPDGLKYVSSKASMGSYDPVTGIWTIGDLPVGKNVTLIITVIATKVGIIDNNVTVGSDAFDVNETNNFANFTIEVEDVNNTNSNLISMQRTGTPLLALLVVLILCFIGFSARARIRK